MNMKLLNNILKMTKYTFYGLFLQCVILTVILANNGYSQSHRLNDVQVSLKLENASIEDAFEEIESQTTFKFAYRKSAIKDYVKLSNKFNEEPLGEILLALAEEGDLAFKRVNQ